MGKRGRHARFNPGVGVPYEELRGSIGGDGEREDLRWVRADRPDDVPTTIVQSAMLDTLRRRRQALPAPPRKLFYAWGRHHAVAM